MIVLDERGLVASAKQRGGGCPALAIVMVCRIGVHNRVDSGHICMFEMATEDLIHGGEDPGRIVRMIHLRREGHFHHRCDERGRDAVT